MAKLGELYSITSGGTPSRKHPEYFEDGTISWVKTGDLKDKYLYITDEKITQKALDNSSAKLYPAETVLIAMYGATIGATSILKIDAATNQNWWHSEGRLGGFFIKGIHYIEYIYNKFHSDRRG
jgi:type I restriction enzyme S subunit